MRAFGSCSRGGGFRGTLMMASVVLSGCRPGPDLIVAGSYFPSWMLALVLGVLGTILFWQLFTRIGIDPYLGPRPLVYAGLVLFITLVLWLGVFRG
ncbi:MAG TPA: YtcA family lipoprotein [Candidatus Methylomirabilis sp.]|nr:YtcA family lipoprotein [Candidatus Methylomirabilis sp.]